MSSRLIVNKHETMLLIGKAANNYALKEVVYSESYDDVVEKYGESELTACFKQAKDLGAPYVFLINVQKDQDYIDVVNMVKECDFTYVIFTSLLLSDTFGDTYDRTRIHSTIAYFLGSIGRDTISTFIVTDKHANLYEDVDAFIDSYTETRDNFINFCSTRANLGNVIFVMNNLRNYSLASVPLAAALCTSYITEYPTSDYFGDTVFDIDRWDLKSTDIAYFRANEVRETTVENLLTLNREGGPEKIVFVDRIMKYLKRELDFSEFKGKKYTAHRKLLFQEKLKQYLEQIKGKIIKDYRLDSVEAYLGVPGTVDLVSRIRILPLGCTEMLSLTREVEFA
jgi:hypothetical protein